MGTLQLPTRPGGGMSGVEEGTKGGPAGLVRVKDPLVCRRGKTGYIRPMDETQSESIYVP